MIQSTIYCRFYVVSPSHLFFTDCPSRENRYLLFLTENYAALEILRHYLSDVVGCSSAVTSASASSSDPEGVVEPKDMEPFILFGSSFPKDMEYTQVGTPQQLLLVWQRL